MDQDWIDVTFADFLKIEFQDQEVYYSIDRTKHLIQNAILTFLVEHEAWGYFQVSCDWDELEGYEDVPFNNIDIATWYTKDIDGSSCDWDLKELDENPREGIKVKCLYTKEEEEAIKSAKL
tara:strand:- start:1182 stop:1544 length:363 start_codon:yes stop_codon:yes gene_type:complete